MTFAKQTFDDEGLMLNMTLPKRTWCGFNIFSNNGKANVTFKYPVTINFNETGDEVTYNNTSSLVWGGERYRENDCFSEECSKEFNIKGSLVYFHFANWDRLKNNTILFGLTLLDPLPASPEEKEEEEIGGVWFVTGSIYAKLLSMLSVLYVIS